MNEQKHEVAPKVIARLKEMFPEFELADNESGIGYNGSHYTEYVRLYVSDRYDRWNRDQWNECKIIISSNYPSKSARGLTLQVASDGTFNEAAVRRKVEKLTEQGKAAQRAQKRRDEMDKSDAAVKQQLNALIRPECVNSAYCANGVIVVQMQFKTVAEVAALYAACAEADRAMRGRGVRRL